MNGGLFRFLVLLVMCKVHLYINVYLVTFLVIKMKFLFAYFVQNVQ